MHNNYGEKDNESLLLHYGFCQQESPLKAPPGAGSPGLWLRRAARRTRHKPRRRSGPNMTGCGAAVKAPAEAADAAALGMQVRPLLAAVQGAFLAQLAAWLLYGEGCEEG